MVRRLQDAGVTMDQVRRAGPGRGRHGGPEGPDTRPSGLRPRERKRGREGGRERGGEGGRKGGRGPVGCALRTAAAAANQACAVSGRGRGRVSAATRPARHRQRSVAQSVLTRWQRAANAAQRLLRALRPLVRPWHGPLSDHGMVRSPTMAWSAPQAPHGRLQRRSCGGSTDRFTGLHRRAGTRCGPVPARCAGRDHSMVGGKGPLFGPCCIGAGDRGASGAPRCGVELWDRAVPGPAACGAPRRPEAGGRRGRAFGRFGARGGTPVVVGRRSRCYGLMMFRLCLDDAPCT